MKIRAIIAAALVVAQPVFAEELTLDTKRSLATLQSELEALPAPKDTETVALAAVSFLRAVEVALQERYRTNADLGDSMIGIPILRLPVPPNPDPDPFKPEFIADLFEGVDADMDKVRVVLAAANLSSDDTLVVDVAALWFDVNADGNRNTGEGALEFIGAALVGAMPGTQIEVPSEGLIVHFDAADVEWLAAYTHLLSAVSEIILAFDPTDVIADVTGSVAAMVEIKGNRPSQSRGLLTGEERLVDAIAIVYGALNRVPDGARIVSARDHLLKMIDRNRAFWKLVGEETDNSLEWIPNAEQDAALGFSMPAETGIVWQGVLSDAEAVLKGELLVPYWRTEPGGGVNVAALIADPPAFDLVNWFQGAGLVQYMEKGPLVTGENYTRFQRMFFGNALMYMVLLN